jgi:hypothetical protein
MSTWRQKAIDIAPELKKDFQDPDLSPYTVFSALLDLLLQAHRDNNSTRIEKIYDYAGWCFRQKNQTLWNAAGVSFYEHLGDNELVFSQCTKWLKKDIYFDVRDLLALRLGEDKLAKADNWFAWKKDQRKT